MSICLGETLVKMLSEENIDFGQKRSKMNLSLMYDEFLNIDLDSLS
jgi:hypothetical protein